MPANAKSLRLTDLYRQRLLAVSERVGATARRSWPRIQDLDSTPWAEIMAQELTRAQALSVRLTAGYIGAFIRSEGGKGTVPAIDSRQYVGLSRDGRALSEALQSPLIGVKADLKRGVPATTALQSGLLRAERTVKFEAVQTGRDYLVDATDADPRLTGWQRAVAGTCAACMAQSGTSGPQFEVHPGCECVPMPTVKGAPNKFPLATGAVLFAAMSQASQEKAVGKTAAELIRNGEPLENFVSHSKIETQDNYITQRPAGEVEN